MADVDDDDDIGETEGHADGSKDSLLFRKELRLLMYGLGDDRNPYNETVELVEKLSVEMMLNLAREALAIGKPGKIQAEDIIFLIRKDQRKYSRVRELFTMNEALQKARKAYDTEKLAKTK